MKIKEILENKVIQFKSKKQLQMDELKKKCSLSNLK